jgi:GalNAc-alpha-(1->4)-GalNAc-alpha-(1->3)-diNAcBac-PP-undecaprenol alpha-1,4-N-acetyl-D-galactosaminyltransferase
MEESIASHGLQNQWNWLGQRTDIVALLHQHDALIHASYLEGMPNAVCEALACGRPVIVSDAMDHSKLVQNGINGFLFDWRDPEKLADTLWNFAQLPLEQRHAMGKNGRLFAEKNLTLANYIDQFENLFTTLTTKNTQ